MANRKRWDPPSSAKGKKPKTFKPVKRTTVPAFPTDPIRPPSQPKLDGFTTPELEEIESAIETYKDIEDRVKGEQKKLKNELERAAMDLIEVLLKHKQKSIVIGGWSAQITDTIKVKVKGVPKPKESDEFKDKVGDHLENSGIPAERLS